MRLPALIPILFLLQLSSHAKVENFALVIGAETGLERERRLRFAVQDARRVAAVLRQSHAFEDRHFSLLANPDLGDVLRAFEDIRTAAAEARRKGYRSVMFLYYSGHGSAKGLHIDGKVLGREELITRMEAITTDLRISIVDACESGDLLRRKGGEIIANRTMALQDDLKSRGSIMLSSSSHGELSQESETYKGSVFTYHLVNGLKGPADYNLDRKVTIQEAFDYARASTRMDGIAGSHGRQNPSFDFDIVGESDPLLVKLESRRSKIFLSRFPAGQLEIYNAESLEMECIFWTTGRDSSYFDLPGGKYVFRFPEGDGFKVKTVDLTWKESAQLELGDFRYQKRESVRHKGSRRPALDMWGMQVDARMAHPGFSMPMVGGALVHQSRAARHGIAFGFGRRIFPGFVEDIHLAVDAYKVGYTLRLPVWTLPYAVLVAGIDGNVYGVKQSVKDERFGTQPVPSTTGPVRLQWTAESLVMGASLPLEMRVRLPKGSWLAASGAVSGYGFEDRSHDGRIALDWNLEPGISLGIGF